MLLKWGKNRIDLTKPCSIHKNVPMSRGYVQILVRGKLKYAHREAWEDKYGPIDEGLVIDHVCENKRCCEPDHLEPVTCQENIRRQAKCNSTHCQNGHEWTEENTYTHLSTDGYVKRACKQCMRNAKAKWRSMKTL